MLSSQENGPRWFIWGVADFETCVSVKNVMFCTLHACRTLRTACHVYITCRIQTNSMEQNPSWEADSFSLCQEPCRLLRKPTFPYRVLRNSGSFPESNVALTPHSMSLHVTGMTAFTLTAHNMSLHVTEDWLQSLWPLNMSLHVIEYWLQSLWPLKICHCMWQDWLQSPWPPQWLHVRRLTAVTLTPQYVTACDRTDCSRPDPLQYVIAWVSLHTFAFNVTNIN
jgi:hypothetical protein